MGQRELRLNPMNLAKGHYREFRTDVEDWESPIANDSTLRRRLLPLP